MTTQTLGILILFREIKDCTSCAERLRSTLGEIKGIAAAILRAARRKA